MHQPLKRDRPLWELYVVQGRNDNRVAVIAKIHHAIIEGVSGLELLAKMSSHTTYQTVS
jgi:hypothetical protein